MLISVPDVLMSCTACMAVQFSLPKKDEFCCPFPHIFSSLSGLDAGTGEAAMAGTVVRVAGIESILNFFGFVSCWLPGRKLPTTTW